jgi:hypothetical protein
MQAILLLPVERLIDWARLLRVDSGKHVVLQAVTSTPRVPPVNLQNCQKSGQGCRLEKVQNMLCYNSIKSLGRVVARR